MNWDEFLTAIEAKPGNEDDAIAEILLSNISSPAQKSWVCDAIRLFHKASPYGVNGFSLGHLVCAHKYNNDRLGGPAKVEMDRLKGIPALADINRDWAAYILFEYASPAGPWLVGQTGDLIAKTPTGRTPLEPFCQIMVMYQYRYRRCEAFKCQSILGHNIAFDESERWTPCNEYKYEVLTNEHGL